MEKLELKHLSPYLPYGLKIKTSNNQGNVIRQIQGIDISEEFILACGYINYIESDNYYPYTLKSCKPILRPLSDLNKKIQIAEHFMTFKEHLRRFFPAESIGTNIATWSNRSVEWLCEYHFDIFGLIDKGLAISYSDLQSTSNEG